MDVTSSRRKVEPDRSKVNSDGTHLVLLGRWDLKQNGRSIEVPQRPYLQVDLGARWGSDNVSAQSSEISYHQPINDIWWMFAGGSGDYTQALRGSTFAPIQGGSFMARGAGYVGVIDREKFEIIAKWRPEGAAAFYPMALDEEHHRLFLGCRKPARLLILGIDGHPLARIALINSGPIFCSHVYIIT